MKKKVFANLYGDLIYLKPKNLKFSIGDKVRISKYKRRVFDKVYTPNWTEELFVVDHVMMTKPVTYKIVDLLGEKLEGSFYEKELQKAKQQTFRIEKVVRHDNKKKGIGEMVKYELHVLLLELKHYFFQERLNRKLLPFLC